MKVSSDKQSHEVKSEEYYQKVLESTLGIPFSDGNDIKVLQNGREIFPAMIGAIREAEEQIEMLTYVYWTGDIAYRFAKELSQKAEQGIRVRLILDSIGAAFMPSELTEMMEEAGVQIEWFRPVPQWKLWKTDNRTHRKVLICDAKVAYTGGVGIAEEWEGDARNPSEWRDTHFEVKGPAIFGLYAAFMENWIEAGRNLKLESFWEQTKQNKNESNGGPSMRVQVVRTSASVRWSDIVMLYQTLIKMAQKSISITTAYFNPNSAIVNLLTDASRQGLEINIMIPGRHLDHRVAEVVGGESFDTLLDAGINLWHYQKTMLHSKIIVVDDLVCCVGSANFNHRSMLKDDEVNMVVIDNELASELNASFRDDLDYCVQIDKDGWRKRSVVRKGIEKLASLIKQEV
jgi:cardiolipin synthase